LLIYGTRLFYAPQFKIFLDRTILPVLSYNHCARKNVVEQNTHRPEKILTMRKEDYNVSPEKF